MNRHESSAFDAPGSVPAVDEAAAPTNGRRAEQSSGARPAPTMSLAYRIVALGRFPVRLVFRPRVEGLEHVPRAGGYVLASNQLSNLDGVALASAVYPRQVRWLGKAELFRRPFGGLLREFGIFPVRRGAGDVEAIATAVAFAREGQAVGIFPEGTRRSKGLRKKRAPRGHTGAARVALAAAVPLVPAAITGTERLTLLRRWRITFGPPVSVAELDANPRLAARELTRRLMGAIAELEAGLTDRVPASPFRLHPRHKVDIAGFDLLFALGASLTARRRPRERRVLDAWAGGAQGLVCLSVRSGLDLLLEALELPPGDEIVVSAVTHPDMVRIIEAHKLRALPVDIDPATLAPRLDALERAIGTGTRMILVAHLFGSTVDLAPIAEIARQHGLLLVEDCAQSWHGPHECGDPEADVSLFSFGSIKTATALGGALVRVEDETLRACMRAVNDDWPVQPRIEFARRVVKFSGLHVLANPRIYGLFARALRGTGHELDDVVNGAVRGFPGDLMTRIRRRPSAPLLALLERRLRTFSSARLERRAAFGDAVAANLPPTIAMPGRTARAHTHWLFPVVATAPAALVSSLRQAGFDASVGTSAICAVRSPVDRPDLIPTAALDLMGDIVFVPAYPELGRDLDRLIAALRDGGAT